MYTYVLNEHQFTSFLDDMSNFFAVKIAHITGYIPTYAYISVKRVHISSW